MTVLSLLTAVLVLVALAGGLVTNRRARRRRAEGAAGTLLSVEDLLNPLAALTALILAFVLVQTFISYREARQASVQEAGAVLSEFRAADLLREPAADSVRASIACYARSVARVEWPAMDRQASSALPDRWAERALAGLRGEMRTGTSGSVISAVIAADSERTTSRRVRLGEALPSVPPALSWLLILASSAFVFLYGFFTDPRVSPRALRVILSITAILLIATVAVIQDLDRPYGGVAAVEPFAMRAVEQTMSGRLAMTGVAVPCDPRGR